MSNIPYIKLEAAPSVEPVTLSEAKAYLKVDGNDDDNLITNLIKSVRETAEYFLKSALITQSWKISYDQYTPSEIKLPMGPVQSVTSVTTFARDGSTNIVNSSTYYLSAGNEKLIFDATPFANRIEVIYVSGYGDDESAVPYAIKQGMLVHIAEIYDGRAGSSIIPPQAMEFYQVYREVRV